MYSTTSKGTVLTEQPAPQNPRKNGIWWKQPQFVISMMMMMLAIVPFIIAGFWADASMNAEPVVVVSGEFICEESNTAKLSFDLRQMENWVLMHKSIYDLPDVKEVYLYGKVHGKDVVFYLPEYERTKNKAGHTIFHRRGHPEHRVSSKSLDELKQGFIACLTKLAQSSYECEYLRGVSSAEQVLLKKGILDPGEHLTETQLNNIEAGIRWRDIMQLPDSPAAFVPSRAMYLGEMLSFLYDNVGIYGVPIYINPFVTDYSHLLCIKCCKTKRVGLSKRR